MRGAFVLSGAHTLIGGRLLLLLLLLLLRGQAALGKHLARNLLVHGRHPEELPVVVVVLFSPDFDGSLLAAAGDAHDRSATECHAGRKPCAHCLTYLLLLWLLIVWRSWRSSSGLAV